MLLIRKDLGVEPAQMDAVLHLIQQVLPDQIGEGSTVEEVSYIRSVHDATDLLQCQFSKVPGGWVGVKLAERCHKNKVTAHKLTAGLLEHTRTPLLRDFID